MKIAWRIGALFFLVLSALMIIVGSQNYPYIDRLGPGPAFFPIWVSIVTAALSLGLLYQTFTGKSGMDISAELMPKDLTVLRRGIVCLLGLVGCIVFLESVGFCLTFFLFLVLVPFSLGERRWWCLLAFSLLGSFGLFYVFYHWLQLPLPLGVLSI